MYLYGESVFPDPDELTAILHELGVVNVVTRDGLADGILCTPAGDLLVRVVVLAGCVRVHARIPCPVPAGRRRDVKVLLYGLNAAFQHEHPGARGVLGEEEARVQAESVHFHDLQGESLPVGVERPLVVARALAEAAFGPLLRVLYGGADPEAEAERAALAREPLDVEPPEAFLDVYRSSPN